MLMTTDRIAAGLCCLLCTARPYGKAAKPQKCLPCQIGHTPAEARQTHRQVVQLQHQSLLATEQDPGGGSLLLQLLHSETLPGREHAGLGVGQEAGDQKHQAQEGDCPEPCLVQSFGQEWGYY